MTTSRKSSTKVSSPIKLTNQFSDLNLESFVCVWLDENVNSTKDNRNTQQDLRQVINHLRTFNNIDEFERYIQEITEEKIILIVSSSLSRQLIPGIHDLPQFSAFYIYGKDKKANERWAYRYPKINGVFIERSKLIAKITTDQAARAKVEDGASISIIHCGSEFLQADNTMFMWFQLFIEVLLHMRYKSTDRKELIDICKNSYKGNNQEMKIIEEFEKNYKPENAIWWYTRESCFHRMLNKALRVQDADMLLAFRFFIIDIAKQMKSEYGKFIRTSDTRSISYVYRGQIIRNNELELIKNSIGEFLSMNSFLSTSYERLTALYFARLIPTTKDTQRIIFEITINPRLQTKAFCDVTELSYFENEDEVLITLGALFRIDKVIEDTKDRIWTAKVSLASEDDDDLKEIFSYMKTTIGNEFDLNSLGKILLEMDRPEQAYNCYQRMLDESNLVASNAESGLGMACLDCNEIERSLKHLTNALEIRQDILSLDHADIGECYCQIGMVQWWGLKDYEQALVNLKKAIEIQERALSSDSLALAITYHNIANTYNLTQAYDLALEYYNKALKIQRKVLPHDHPKIASTYYNLGQLYTFKGDHSKALKHYEKSIDIERRILPPTHENIAKSEQHIRLLKDKQKK